MQTYSFKKQFIINGLSKFFWINNQNYYLFSFNLLIVESSLLNKAFNFKLCLWSLAGIPETKEFLFKDFVIIDNDTKEILVIDDLSTGKIENLEGIDT